MLFGKIRRLDGMKPLWWWPVVDALIFRYQLLRIYFYEIIALPWRAILILTVLAGIGYGTAWAINQVPDATTASGGRPTVAGKHIPGRPMGLQRNLAAPRLANQRR